MRETVRQLKENGVPKPWTEDPVFQDTYFCNVRREDDRVTRWIRTNWSPEKIGWDDYEYAMILARFLNWPDTLGRLSAQEFPLSNFKDVQDWLETWAEEGKIWGNAYVVTTHGIPMGKAEYLCQRVLPAAYELVGAGKWRNQYPPSGTTLAARHKVLMQLEGMGSFMAAQVIADLKNTPDHPLAKTRDWFTWAAPGPGSLRGMQWFYGRMPTALEFGPWMEDVQEYVNKETGLDLHAQDVQNCLCEFDKYMRVKTGQGRSKRGYPGRS